MDMMEKLAVLTDAAKYDVSCTSSGASRRGRGKGLGNSVASGICHSFAGDGRCISLLKVLQSNDCQLDCRYCVNRRSNDTPRVSFTPRELADLTMNFYRRNYIEGLFLSSAVCKNADFTCEMMLGTLSILRREYGFQGYIHVKAIPGADPGLIWQLGLLADRISVNIEFPSRESLSALAPGKTPKAILAPMGQIQGGILQSANEISLFKSAPRFAQAGQSTQMIIGATPETDKHILTLSQALYRKYQLKRVFFSAYVPVVSHKLLPPPGFQTPLLREHRLYQADWLMRFYGFEAEELFSGENASLDLQLDPKCQWALGHMDQFPVEINRAPHEMLLRVPGIGVKSAWRIVENRRLGPLHFEGLKRLGVVLKRARYFITCSGRMEPGVRSETPFIRAALTEKGPHPGYTQLSFFDSTPQDGYMALTGQL